MFDLFTCPYCGAKSVLDNKTSYSEIVVLHNDNAHKAKIGLSTFFRICASIDCRQISLDARLFKTAQNAHNKWVAIDSAIETWRLLPRGNARPLPEYIPQAIRDDYKEACLISDLSPKASATLSRRCLQAMVRDRWGAKGRTLNDEINSIQDKIDPDTWEAIHAVREVGNVGAHMEKDIDLIVPIEPGEAESLIGLIELLIEDWYIDRHKRQQRVKDVECVASSWG